MAFDFKKEHKEIYGVKSKPQILTLPQMSFIAVRGQGDPNEKEGAYQRALMMLYNVAYFIKMSYKTDYQIEGFFEYVMPPLEGYWWQCGEGNVGAIDKSKFQWLSLIRQPEFIKEAHINWAKEAIFKKKKLDCSEVNLISMEEGLCVQVLHVGPYDTVVESQPILDEFISKEGYELDLSEERRYHEVYISDPFKTTPENLKTILRLPIKKK